MRKLFKCVDNHYNLTLGGNYNVLDIDTFEPKYLLENDKGKLAWYNSKRFEEVPLNEYQLCKSWTDADVSIVKESLRFYKESIEKEIVDFANQKDYERAKKGISIIENVGKLIAKL